MIIIIIIIIIVRSLAYPHAAPRTGRTAHPCGKAELLSWRGIIVSLLQCLIPVIHVLLNVVMKQICYIKFAVFVGFLYSDVLRQSLARFSRWSA